MNIKKLMSILFILILTGTACKKKIKNIPGKITVDGKKIIFKKLLAFKYNLNNVFVIQMFNHKKINCDEILRDIPPTKVKHEITARVSVSEKGKWPAVGIGKYTKVGGYGNKGKVKIVKKPKKIGDKLKLCITEEYSFTPGIGQYETKKIKAIGCFEGRYCGSK